MHKGWLQACWQCRQCRQQAHISDPCPGNRRGVQLSHIVVQCDDEKPWQLNRPVTALHLICRGEGRQGARRAPGFKRASFGCGGGKSNRQRSCTPPCHAHSLRSWQTAVGWRHSGTGRHNWGRWRWLTGSAVQRNDGRVRHRARQGYRGSETRAAGWLAGRLAGWLAASSSKEAPGGPLQSPRLRLWVACVECSEGGIGGKGQTLDLQGGGEAQSRGITCAVLDGWAGGGKDQQSSGAAHQTTSWFPPMYTAGTWASSGCDSLAQLSHRLHGPAGAMICVRVGAERQTGTNPPAAATPQTPLLQCSHSSSRLTAAGWRAWWRAQTASCCQSGWSSTNRRKKDPPAGQRHLAGWPPAAQRCWRCCRSGLQVQ